MNGIVRTTGGTVVVMDEARLDRGTGMSALATAPLAPAGNGGQSDDRTLVARVRRGDDVAFEQLYHAYHRRITAYINGMVHDHARAEDIAQDVFMSALRRMRETDRPIAFKPWIYEIAKNACIDQFRRSRRAEEVSYDAEEGLGPVDYGKLVSTAALPEARMESKQRLDDLRGAFGGLSEAHHQILVMRELEGLSYREIGERLGMSRPSVESTLFRARRRLTEEYEELVSGARCQRIHAIIAEAAAGSLGARDERRLARHVSHCQPCRRQARVAGLQIAVAGGMPVRAKIAALLPLPMFLRRRWAPAGGSGHGAEVTAGSHLSRAASQWTAQLGSTVDPGWFKAAATAATVAVAGLGAGVATRDVARSGPAPRASIRSLIRDAGDRRGGVDDLAATRAATTVAAAEGSAQAGPSSPSTAAVAPAAGGQAAAPAAPAGGGDQLKGSSGTAPAGAGQTPAAGAIGSAQASAGSGPAADRHPIENAARRLLTPPTGSGASGSTPAAPQHPQSAPDPATIVQSVSTVPPAATDAAGAAAGAASGVAGAAGTAAGEAASGAAGAARGAGSVLNGD
jgi:RNA polymerase sigma factor (sigma-70 family)